MLSSVIYWFPVLNFECLLFNLNMFFRTEWYFLEKHYFRFLDRSSSLIGNEIPAIRGSSELLHDLVLSIAAAINSDCRQGEKRPGASPGGIFFLAPDKTWEGRQAVRRCCTRCKITLRRPGWHDPGGSGAKLVVWLTLSRQRGVRPTRSGEGWRHPLSADGSIVSTDHKLSRASLGPHFLPSFLPFPAGGPMAGDPRSSLLPIPDRASDPHRYKNKHWSQRPPSSPEPPSRSVVSAGSSLFAPRNT